MNKVYVQLSAESYAIVGFEEVGSAGDVLAVLYETIDVNAADVRTAASIISSLPTMPQEIFEEDGKSVLVTRHLLLYLSLLAKRGGI